MTADLHVDLSGTSGSGPDRPWPKRSRWLRVGAPVLAVGAIAAAVGAATAAGHGTPTGRIVGPPLAEVRRYVDLPDLPVTYQQAVEAGTVDQYDWGDRCDVDRPYDDTGTTLARVAFPSTYAPPCVPVWDGDRPWRDQGGEVLTTNGGATAPGVTATTIKVVFYLPGEQDISKQLQQFGVADGESTTLRGVQDLVEMSNHLYETYGRKVELIPFHASGDGRSPAAAQADAVRVVEMGAFASIGGPAQTSAYQHELARSHVLCIQCGYASTDDVLAADAPYAWGYLATPDQQLFGVFGYGTGLLANNKATFAGSAELRNTTRKFGIVHYEQDPPVFGPLKAAAIAKFDTGAVDVGPIIQYLLDPNSLNAQAQAIIGRLKREGVTSVVFLGDPLMPRLLTQQATKQEYFPEWIFTGTVFTDTTAVARLYDQRQMAHAFGGSSNPARTKPEVSESWRLYDWYFGKEPPAPRTMLIWGPVVQELFLGVHMAGPHLRAETFAGGLFRYPPTGATHIAGKDGITLFADGYLKGDTTPAISFGFHRGDDEADYVAVDDFTNAWWDPDAVGPDENGVVGKGMWMYTGLGLRSMLSDPTLPEGVNADFLFHTRIDQVSGPLAETAIAAGLGDLPIAASILDEVPPLDQLPDYPAWPGSPAAGG